MNISQSVSLHNKTGYPVAAVAFPIAVPGVYDYSVPEKFRARIVPGTPVLVPLRNRETWGVVVALKDSGEVAALKEIISLKEERIGESGGSLLALYEWIADYYQCDVGRVFKPLMRKGVMKSKPKRVTVFSVAPNAPFHSLNEKYRALAAQLEQAGAVTASDAQEKWGISRASLTQLVKKGVVISTEKTVLREAFELTTPVAFSEVSLTSEQRNAVSGILAGEGSAAKPFLLYGITGSGKTHVYIELAARMLARGKGVIILVPEISLTPQTIERFRSALGDVLTVIHSNMSDGERRDSLQELFTGKKRAVIGVRSAILAPVDNVGLIIVDEEHDGSYKQSDMDPRYNARDVAVVRAKMQHALVVLGSATPSLESYHNARNGKYHLIKLSQRFGEATLPQVSTIDMKLEQAANNWKPLSQELSEAIAETIENNRQVILLLNRRGFSTMLLCQECGYTAECPDCSVSLRYHRADTSLKCHVCGFLQPAPHECPQCRGEKIKYKGTGIQKIEEVLHETFPSARVLRMDQDSTRKKGSHFRILSTFAERKADILLGTQMVAKGLNFPGVALVGVITADTGLHIPDFRASERTFQLLTQVAGRAGRADSSGKVLIQTYSPDDSAIMYACSHDYESFFEHEIHSRRELFYPPFSRLARIIVEGCDEGQVQEVSERIASQLRYLAKEAIDILGPVPAVLEKVSKEFRYTLLAKQKNLQKCSAALAELRKMNRKLPASVKLVIDVDPVNML